VPDPDGLHWLHNLALAFGVGVVAMLVVGWVRPLSQVQHDARFGTASSPVSVVPWAHATRVSALVLVGVGVIYGGLALLASGS